MAQSLRTLFRARKALGADAADTKWTEPAQPDNKIGILFPLEMGGAVMQGLYLRGRAYIDAPQEEISFQLEYQPGQSKRKRVLLSRVDWRPRKPHENDNRGPANLRMLKFRQTHVHRFEHNWLEAEGRPRFDLPIAEPIMPDYQTFAELLDAVGLLFRINDISSIAEPIWTPELFPR